MTLSSALLIRWLARPMILALLLVKRKAADLGVVAVLLWSVVCRLGKPKLAV